VLIGRGWQPSGVNWQSVGGQLAVVGRHMVLVVLIGSGWLAGWPVGWLEAVGSGWWISWLRLATVGQKITKYGKNPYMAYIVYSYLAQNQSWFCYM
jgi:hypothetical protein